MQPSDPPYPPPPGRPGPPYPPPPGPWRPPQPPRRRKNPGDVLGKLLLLSVPVGVVLLIAVGVMINHFTSTVPREYMEDWSVSLGSPRGYGLTYTAGNAEWRYLEYRATCNSAGCSSGSTPPGETLREWLNDNGFSISATELGECFQSVTGCTKVYYHEGHPVHLQIRQAFVDVHNRTARYEFSLKMYWNS